MKRILFALVVLGLSLPASAQVLGPQEVVVIPFTVNGYQPFSQADAANTMGYVNYRYQQMSDGLASVSVKVANWVTVTDCGITSILQQGRAGAAAQGITWSPYARFVFAQPYTGGCTYGNITLGHDIIVSGDALSWGIVAHELGHSFGLHHANGLVCAAPDIIAGSSCYHYEYGNPFDIMGSGEGDFDAIKKAQLRWITLPQIAASGSYTLGALEGPSAYPKGLLLLRVNPVTSALSELVIEHRQMTPSSVEVMLSNIGSDAPDEYLNMHPDGPAKFGTLDVGQTFTDPLTGIVIQVLAADTVQASVAITLPGSTPPPPPPPPPPVNCVQGTWYVVSTSDSYSAWTIVGDHQERTKTTTTNWQRDTPTQPANGGAACGPSTQTTTTTTIETQPLPPPQPPPCRQRGKSGQCK